MKKTRVAILGVVASALLLVWAVPAFSSAKASTVTVTAGKPSEFRFQVKGAAKAGTVTFKVTNKGALPHDFSINKKKTKLLSPGQSTTLKVTFKKKGKYAYLCTVSGHAAAGMKGTLVVK